MQTLPVYGLAGGFYLFIHAESCYLFHKNLQKLHVIWKKKGMYLENGKNCTNAARPILDLNLCIISSGHVLLLDQLDKSLCLFRLDNVPYFSFIIEMLKKCGRISFAIDFQIGYTDFKYIRPYLLLNANIAS